MNQSYSVKRNSSVEVSSGKSACFLLILILFCTLLVYYIFNNYYLVHSSIATNFSTVKEKEVLVYIR
jgi:hypothetical protein